MGRAMERSVNVNALSASGGRGDDVRAKRADGFASVPADTPEDDPHPVASESSLGKTGNSSQGSCLYFGPAGQRCDRPAIKEGFCARHQPGAASEAARTPLPRRVVAILTLLAAMWPLVADLVRQVIRWIHLH
jgi:hypothetical protein